MQTQEYTPKVGDQTPRQVSCKLAGLRQPRIRGAIMLEASTITSIYDASFLDTHWHKALDVCGKAVLAEFVIVLSSGEVVLKNSAASEFLETVCVMRLKKNNHLMCLIEGTQLMFKTSVTDVSLTADGEATEVSEMFEILRTEDRPRSWRLSHLYVGLPDPPCLQKRRSRAPAD